MHCALSTPDVAHGHVGVWQATLDELRVCEQQFWGFLSDDERHRAQAFYFTADRYRSAMSRGLLRVLLGGYLGVPPRQLSFTYGAFGKPELAGARVGQDQIHFNVAHSGSLVLIAIACVPVGIDVERHRSDLSYEAIAERSFGPAEIAELRAVPDEARRQAFFDGWTRKEAYVKALGSGLSTRLDSFVVSLAPGCKQALLGCAEQRRAQAWTVTPLPVEPGYSAALAVAGPCQTIAVRRFDGERDSKRDQVVRRQNVRRVQATRS